MADKPDVVIFTDGRAQRDDIPPRLFAICPHCESETTEGFGLAGGGFGPYSTCDTCGIVGKVQLEDDFDV